MKHQLKTKKIQTWFVEAKFAFGRSEMGIICQKVFIYGVWDEEYTLGRFLPQLTTLAVLTLIIRQHFTAAFVFKVMWYFIAV